MRRYEVKRIGRLKFRGYEIGPISPTQKNGNWRLTIHNIFTPEIKPENPLLQGAFNQGSTSIQQAYNKLVLLENTVRLKDGFLA
jgi:hypothetical protein